MPAAPATAAHASRTRNCCPCQPHPLPPAVAALRCRQTDATSMEMQQTRRGLLTGTRSFPLDMHAECKLAWSMPAWRIGERLGTPQRARQAGRAPGRRPTRTICHPFLTALQRPIPSGGLEGSQLAPAWLSRCRACATQNRQAAARSRRLRSSTYAAGRRGAAPRLPRASRQVRAAWPRL